MSTEIVEAIEEGKIVRVSDDYARREGLLVLRKVDSNKSFSAARETPQPVQRIREKITSFTLEPLRRPLRRAEGDIVSSLIDNFHWTVQRKRKEKNMTRKQVAEALSVGEEQIKMIENGVLPSQDYILINKLERYFGLNLRKGEVNYQESPMKKALSSSMKEEGKMSSKERISDNLKEMEKGIIGEDIEIFDEDESNK